MLKPTNTNLTILLSIASLCTIYFSNISKEKTKELPTSLHCGQTSVWENALQQNPSLLKQHEIFEEELLKASLKNNNNASQESVLAIYELPVVVHVIHSYGPENISDAQIQNGINHLNQAFAHEGIYDQGNGVDTEIQFCLATTDPNGNLTNGINRVVSSLTTMTEPLNDLELKNLIRWDPKNYINIWIVKSICSDPGDCFTAGYATLPSAHGTEIDGIVEEAEYFGTTEAKSAVTAHEMGHYLGLYHTFQGGCTNNNCQQDGDRVCDTPPDQTTVAAPCYYGLVNSCTNDVNPSDPNNPFTTDQNDYDFNFMDYGFLECLNSFTQGQSVRMQNSITTARNSLLNSVACSSPCPIPFTANFSIPNDTVILGSTVTFTNNSIGGLYFEWTIDQTTTPNNTFTFNDVGTFLVSLNVTNNDPNCVANYSLPITVICEAQASFIASTTQVMVGQTIDFTSTSTNTSNTEWTVNGTSSGTNTTFQFSSPTAAGNFQICLIASNAFCESEFCQQISVLGNNTATEICNNGFDDDGDGLIDCYDPDCCEDNSCANNFYSDCVLEGCPPTLNNDFAMQVEWSSPASYYSNYHIIAGDLTGDGIPNLLQRTNSQVHFTSGVDGSVFQSVTLYDQGSQCIGDHDGDGIASVFMGGVERIKRLEADGTITLGAVLPNGGGGWYQPKSALADFNQDGKPELMVLNHIIDTESLEILSSIPLDNFVYISDYGLGVPMDVLPDNYCDDCAGMEYILGPFVWSVHPTTFEFTLINSVALNDPFYSTENTTSIADIDKDGDLDAVVRGGLLNGLFVWDIQTETIIAKEEDGNFPFPTYGHNHPAVADLDGDGFPEIICRNGNDMVAYNGDLKSADWTSPIQEFAGNATQSIFDINGDGLPEVIYRDNAFLRIINGQTGELLSSMPCSSGTNTELPIILDIDADGEAEIACECNLRVKVFGSAGAPWANTRKMWNQFSYTAVNINDDLTIPAVQQPHHLIGDKNVMNSFLQQYSIPFELDDCDEICDNGIDDDNDGLIDCLDDDCCESGFCNNQLPPCNDCQFDGSVDLGPDVEVCDNAVYNFDAGTGFSTYLWSDQTTDQTFTAPGGGTYWVIATDSCGNNYSDTVIVSIVAQTQANLGADIYLCEGDSTTLSAGIFDNYEWFQGGSLICQGCETITVSPTATSKYEFLGSSSIGCFTSDFISIFVNTNVETTDTMYLCEGDSIEIFGNFIFSANNFSQTFIGSNNCDSISNIEILMLENSETNETITLCEGQTVNILNQNISQDTILLENLSASNGCDSTHTYTIIFNPTIQTQESIQLCEGDTIEVFGQNIFSSQTLNQTFSGNNNCDSTHTVEVILVNEILTNETITFCEGTSVTIQNITISQDTTIIENLVAANGCDSIHTFFITEIPISQTQQTIEICEGDSVEVFGNFVFDSNTFSQTFSANNTCDSTHTVEVIVFENSETEETITLCQGQTVNILNQNISQDTILLENLSAANGCDSTHTYTVIFNSTIQTQETIQLCEGDTIEVFGQNIFSTQTLNQTFSGNNNCDSTHTVEVIWVNEIETNETITFCEGTSVTVQNITISQDTTIIENLVAANGCDSIHTFFITEIPVFQTQQTIEICDGDSVEVFGNFVFDSNTFSQTFSANNTCDSTHTVEVIVFENSETEETITLCQGETVNIANQNISQDTILLENLFAANGCDSTHTYTVIFNPTIQTQETIQLCEGDTIEVFGQNISSSETLSQTLMGNNNCDSTHTVDVILVDEIETEEIIVLCDGDSFIFGNETFENDTTLVEEFILSNGCDSMHSTILNFNPVFSEDVFVQICEGDSIQIAGATIFQDTILQENFTSINGCDSIVINTVEVLLNIETSEELTICEGDTIEIFGQSIFESTTVEATFNGINGCDSTHIVEVELLNSVTTFENQMGCVGTPITIDGESYSSDTTVTQQLTAINGCDSIHQIVLEFDDIIVISDEVTLCENESVIFFNDTISSTGFYEFTISPLGDDCDTTYQLEVVVNPLPIPIFEILPPCPNEEDGQLNINNTQTSWTYSLDGINFQDSPFENLPPGNYDLWIENEFGCNSISSFEIPENNSPNIILPETATIITNTTIPMPIEYSSIDDLQFSWSPSTGLSCTDCPYPMISISQAQVYFLEVTDGFGCVQSEMISISIDNDSNVFIPNAFTPDGNQFNDRFTIYADARITEVIYLQIFDRWGEMVFEAENFQPNDESLGWDGKLNGEFLNSNVFVYKCEVRTFDNQVLPFTGDLTLVRGE